ncbi:hypothetical protein BN946_scf184960.g6 [Trametes cinnabarina]|uniref:Uncharacterized protein n=1 Tax=Pycnoporus cinnabarinus TaxID=5643 RepID=A0A060SJL3_PYCCI|nr:hypothetical protein BN946_scf184960.g6 [Trametes cinnabarina]
MMATWADLGTTLLPVLLANKDNSAVLRDVDLNTILGATLPHLSDKLTAVELRAFKMSVCRGVKLASLAGAIFNHKDNKKGQQDTYIFYFRELVGHSLRFPDTSNMQYLSHCDAAAELLVHCPEYLSFLEIVRDCKERAGFNHMEEKIYQGLRDLPTVTELAALTLYAQAVTHPYMHTACCQQNGLLLGLFHGQLLVHIQKLINNPDLLLLSKGDYSKAAFDGKEWERPEAVHAVLKLAPCLPHLRHICMGFFTGALKTWMRFCVDSEEGGAIMCASNLDLNAAWISSTNDHNEGALGSYRAWMHLRPNATEGYFNTQAKCRYNGTEDFIQTHIATEEDPRNLHSYGRTFDSSGHKAHRRREQVNYIVAVAQQTAREYMEREQKEKAAAAKVEATQLIEDPDGLAQLKHDNLEEQLEVHRKRFNDKEVPLQSKITVKPAKLAALREALARYHKRPADSKVIPR